MDKAQKKRIRPEIILGIIALLCAALLAYVIVLCRPWSDQEPEPAPQTQPTTEATEPVEETTLPIEAEPELPEPEANPYGTTDFQYNEDNFLTCLAGDYRIGVDVSRYQYEVDWEQVAASGVEFAIIRIGYRGYGAAGTINEDPYAKANLEGALAAGLDVGVYFYSQATTVKEAKEEAKFVLDYIEGYDITMPVVFDWELPAVDNPRTKDVDPRTLTDCILEFCGIVRRAGYTAMPYFNTHQATYDLYLKELTRYEFWLALYTPRMRFPYKVRMWQYSCTGQVPGIEYEVDLNIWFEYDEE